MLVWRGAGGLLEFVLLAGARLTAEAFVNNWIAARFADGFLDNARAYWFDSFEWRRPREAAQPRLRQ